MAKGSKGRGSKPQQQGRWGQNSGNNQKNGQPSKPASDDTRKKEDFEKLINGAHKEIESKATESDMNAMTNDSKPEGADDESLWKIVREARDLYIAAEKRLTDEANKLAQDQLTCETKASLLKEREQQQLEQQRKLDERQTVLDDLTKTIEDRENNLKHREHALLDRENDLRSRESNAKAGFIAERKNVSAIFDEAVEQYREELKELLKKIAEQRTAWLKERATESEQWNQKMVAEKQALDKDRLIFEQKKRELDFAEQAIAGQREHLDEQINERLAIEREEQTHRIQGLERRIDELRRLRERARCKINRTRTS